MSRTLRRLATFILLLTVPLRVYAAAAMVFCSPGSEFAVESGIPAPHAAHASAHGDHANAEHFNSAHEGAAVDLPRAADSDAGSFHDHFSCAACCCAGMIATTGFDWKPQAFPTPAMTSFIVIAVPSTVPQRLERPPRDFLA